MHSPHCLRSHAIALATLALVAHAGCHRLTADPAGYFLAAPLVSPGDGVAGGRVEMLLSDRQRSAFLEVTALAPLAEYWVYVDDELLASLGTDAAGYAAAHASIGSPRLDPRGRRITVRDANDTVVRELAGETHPEYREAEAAPLAAFGIGSASLLTLTLDGRRTASVHLGGAEPGHYEVRVDGAPRAALDAATGAGTAAIDPVDFDPRSAAIELTRDDVGWFAGSGRASIEGLDWCTSNSRGQSLVATSAGNASAALRTRVDCGRRFDVVIAGVPMGDYALLVGDVERGTLFVGEDENGATSGSISFSDGESGATPLDFDPLGQRIEIRQGAALYFELDAFAP
jgi:hypothetical protein